jgi:raffinose/stachyose/melibiose transport system substrate-binding protein
VYKHIFQHFINGATDNAEQLVNDFIAGKTTFQDHPVLLNFFDFIDLTVQHGMPKPLERDLSAEISDFATGKAAMMTGQGAWTEEQILKIAPDMEIGVMGYPVSEDPEQAMIITGADQALRIYKDSPVLQETLDFFNWLYTSDYGKRWFSEVAKVIPPVKDAAFPNMQMPQQMKQIMETGKTGDLAINYSLDSFHQKFGEIMQAYVGGAKSRDQAIEEIQKAWMQFGAPN